MRRAAAALAAGGALVGASAAAADARTATGLRDARYCEVLVVRGATAVVWNTLGLNDCPQDRWTALDATALARELGADAVVLNGPRRLLADEASGALGPTRTFGGLRMREVARIPLGTPPDLSRDPYRDRTVLRRTTWRFAAGRRVPELVAPGGDTYVMQSYAVARDALPGLGRRLDLPAGWQYRTRLLRRPLTLTVRRAATVVQDDLQDTYQLATTTRRPGPRRRHAVSVRGTTRLVAAAAPGTIEDRGTVTGTPFGPGTSGVVGTLQDGALTGRFWLLSARGSISGTFTAPFVLAGGIADLRGTARITGGTGAYRGITAAPLRLRDRFDLGAGRGVLTITGAATY